MVVTLSSGYMAPHSTGGRAVSIAFNMVNMYWPAATVISVIKARRNQFTKHRNWMIRSYLFCLPICLFISSRLCAEADSVCHTISATR
ncbi:DUF2306 domain-containing protein [Bacillus licheniformis]|nr:DUF2306 domain-containing protein [Bacillus licheniformis]